MSVLKADNSELGKKADYDNHYNPDRLFPISRDANRQEIGVDSAALPFCGVDIWNHYEVSWLNQKGKPMVALAEIIYDCTSPNIIESKSLKLYFNSFNNAKFDSADSLQQIIANDLSERLGGEVTVQLRQLSQPSIADAVITLPGENIDDQDISCDTYTVSPDYLSAHDDVVDEVLTSDLLKSNCLVTNQPDWASVQIAYKGKRINREGLLKYIVSLRNHNEFHEQCIERIFVDIMQHCQPEQLTVYGRYTRRGGIDINPYRSTETVDVSELNKRLVRQ
ncbi:MAG: NADPH-dependent 7-cyano-7-deazaguanine reductase QueF [Coxiellaceae bacterium]|nr:NADPH-dependent 7-cyano-7-deazaguanine reductase QueF [Coxiellaceae bacterium]